ncbi:hypothetical protein [Spiroplasma endosymbiont of Glossina fuscipes fuscipes]|uniref:hypothetical protein n=1 Tax=Spiroplasma endosymbiont of Glossina fuscipes fuscipes TaxID=2004463 RepID=UPI003C7792D3
MIIFLYVMVFITMFLLLGFYFVDSIIAFKHRKEIQNNRAIIKSLKEQIKQQQVINKI